MSAGDVFDSGSARISPTAHYTGQVWVRNGLSVPAFDTARGRLFFRGLALPMWAASLPPGGFTLEQMLLQRHRLIDHVVDDEITNHGAEVLLEIASGLSARTVRFGRRFPTLRRLEADLPGMAALKRARLQRVPDEGVEVIDIDVLAERGPLSLATVFDRHLPAEARVVVVAEGLLGYFRRPDADRVWRTLAELARSRPRLTFVFDLHVEDDLRGRRASRAFRRFLEWFARGPIEMPFDTVDEAIPHFMTLGWQGVRVLRPGELPQVVGQDAATGRDLVRVVALTASR